MLAVAQKQLGFHVPLSDRALPEFIKIKAIFRDSHFFVLKKLIFDNDSWERWEEKGQ